MLPTRVEGLAQQRVTDVSTAESHTAALTSGGELYSWGRDRFGQVRSAIVAHVCCWVLIFMGDEPGIQFCIWRGKTCDTQVWEDCRHVVGIWAGLDRAYPRASPPASLFQCSLCAYITYLRTPCVCPRVVVIVRQLGHGSGSNGRLAPKRVESLRKVTVVGVAAGSEHTAVVTRSGNVSAHRRLHLLRVDGFCLVHNR